MSGEFVHADVGGELTESEYHAILGHILDGQALGDIIVSNALADGLIRLPLGGGVDETLVVDSAETNLEWGKRDIRSALRFFFENSNYGLCILGPGGGGAIPAGNDMVGVGFAAEVTGTGTFVASVYFAANTISTAGTQNSDAGYSSNVILASMQPQMHFRGRFDALSAFAANDNTLIGFSTSVSDFDDQNGIIAFRKNGTGAVFGVCDAGGVETTRDTGGDGTSSVELSIDVGGTSLVTFAENGTTVVSTVTTNIPTTAIYPVAGLTNGSAGADRRMVLNGLVTWVES